MSEISEFHINKEYEDLIPPLTTQEYSELENSIRDNGQRDPITLSNRTGKLVIINGHHRYKINQKLGRETKYQIIPFESEAEELQCIQDSLEGRNLNIMTKAAIKLKIKNKLVEIARRNSQANLKQNQPLNTESQTFVSRETLGRQGVNEQLGKEVGTSHETIRKVERILKEAPQHIIDKAMKGQITINKAFKHIQKQEDKEKLLAEAANNTRKLPNGFQIIHGDLRDKCKEIPANSIPLLYTDPSYAEKDLPDYKDIGAEAKRVLMYGGSLVTYANEGYLDVVMDYLRQSGLKYWCSFHVKLTGRHEGLDFRKVDVQSKTLLWFIKGDKLREGIPNGGYIPNFVESKRPDKSHHSREWEQSPVEAEFIIKYLTFPNEIVLDPMMGSGTTGIAALNLKRQFIGIEIKKQDHEIAQANITKHLMEMQERK